MPGTPTNHSKTRKVHAKGKTSSSVFEDIDTIQRKRSLPSEEEIAQLRRGYQMVQTLLHVSTAINSTLNLEELLQRIVDAVVGITECDNGYLLLHNDQDELALALARTGQGRALSRKSFDRSLTAIRKAAQERAPQYVSNTQDVEDLRDKQSIVDLDIKTIICIPLEFEGDLLGVIYADSESISESFHPSDLDMLNAFGAQAAVAIENARRHGELEIVKDSLESQNVTLRQELAQKYQFSGIIGRSHAMQKVFEVVTKVSPLATTVLIEGETGTGKELIARAIHYNSNRRDKPMVSINCGALPKEILESELFGYRKGAFTGADTDRAGLFEAANGGTLFLDEIGEMPIELQVKLLRTLQENEIRRLGEDKSIKIDVRIIAATNRDLEAEAQAGKFRNDLYYRLHVVPIFLPPLRERQEDILPLVDFFLEKYATRMKRDKPILTRSSKEMIFHHTWHGNVRELENAIERAMALGDGIKTIDVDQFEHLIKKKDFQDTGREDTPLKKVLAEWEKEYIRKMLIKHAWIVSRTAIALDISRQQLHNKIKKFGLKPFI